MTAPKIKTTPNHHGNSEDVTGDEFASPVSGVFGVELLLVAGVLLEDSGWPILAKSDSLIADSPV